MDNFLDLIDKISEEEINKNKTNLLEVYLTRNGRANQQSNAFITCLNNKDFSSALVIARSVLSLTYREFKPSYTKGDDEPVDVVSARAKMLKLLYPGSGSLQAKSNPLILAQNPLYRLLAHNPCNYTWAGESHCSQVIFECLTCDLKDAKCCCTECALSCHENCHIIYKDLTVSAYCDCCSLGTCKSQFSGSLYYKSWLLNFLMKNLPKLLDFKSFKGNHLIQFALENYVRQQNEIKDWKVKNVSRGGISDLIYDDDYYSQEQDHLGQLIRRQSALYRDRPDGYKRKYGQGLSTVGSTRDSLTQSMKTYRQKMKILEIQDLNHGFKRNFPHNQKAQPFMVLSPELYLSDIPFYYSQAENDVLVAVLPPNEFLFYAISRMMFWFPGVSPFCMMTNDKSRSQNLKKEQNLVKQMVQSLMEQEVKDKKDNKRCLGAKSSMMITSFSSLLGDSNVKNLPKISQKSTQNIDQFLHTISSSDFFTDMLCAFLTHLSEKNKYGIPDEILTAIGNSCCRILGMVFSVGCHPLALELGEIGIEEREKSREVADEQINGLLGRKLKSTSKRSAPEKLQSARTSPSQSKGQPFDLKKLITTTRKILNSLPKKIALKALITNAEALITPVRLGMVRPSQSVPNIIDQKITNNYIFNIVKSTLNRQSGLAQLDRQKVERVDENLRKFLVLGSSSAPGSAEFKNRQTNLLYNINEESYHQLKLGDYSNQNLKDDRGNEDRGMKRRFPRVKRTQQDLDDQDLLEELRRNQMTRLRMRETTRRPMPDDDFFRDLVAVQDEDDDDDDSEEEDYNTFQDPMFDEEGSTIPDAVDNLDDNMIILGNSEDASMDEHDQTTAETSEDDLAPLLPRRSTASTDLTRDLQLSPQQEVAAVQNSEPVDSAPSAAPVVTQAREAGGYSSPEESLGELYMMGLMEAGFYEGNMNAPVDMIENMVRRSERQYERNIGGDERRDEVAVISSDSDNGQEQEPELEQEQENQEQEVQVISWGGGFVQIMNMI